MELFKMDGVYALPNPELRNIEPFAEIIRRDRGSKNDSQGRKKLIASKELSYIFHVEDPLSPYATYDEDQREQAVIEGLFEKDWKPDQVVLEARKKYVELTETQAIRLLKSARKSVNNMVDYFDTFNIDNSEDPGKAVKDLIANIDKLDHVIDGLEKLEERVQKKNQEDKHIKRGVKATKYNT